MTAIDSFYVNIFLLMRKFLSFISSNLHKGRVLLGRALIIFIFIETVLFIGFELGFLDTRPPESLIAPLSYEKSEWYKNFIAEFSSVAFKVEKTLIKLTLHERKLEKAARLKLFSKTVHREVNNKMNLLNISGLHNILRILSGDETYYIDYCHVDEKESGVIARKIVNDILVLELNPILLIEGA